MVYLINMGCYLFGIATGFVVCLVLFAVGVLAIGDSDNE